MQSAVERYPAEERVVTPSQPRPRVSVIVVTYNSEAVLDPCLREFSDAADVELIISDNGSHDTSIETALRLVPRARVLRNGENLGFAPAVNRAAEIATGDCLLLLNPDATISIPALERLVSTLEERPGVGIIAPLMQDQEGSFSTVAAGHFPTLHRMFTHSSGLSRLAFLGDSFEGHYLLHRGIRGRGRMQVDWVSGGCMLIASEAWQRVGGLSERWFMYAEDIEFCHRAKQAGFEVILDTGVFASHEIGSSSKGVDGRVGTLWLGNLYDFYKSSFARNRGQAILWKYLTSAGFVGRAMVQDLKTALRGRRPSCSTNRFWIYARFLLRESTEIGD